MCKSYSYHIALIGKINDLFSVRQFFLIECQSKQSVFELAVSILGFKLQGDGALQEMV